MAQKVLKSLYVDNLVTSVDNLEEALNLKAWAITTLASAQMELREWEGGFVEESGIGPLISSGCGLDFGKAISQGLGKETTLVLGYKWSKIEDSLSVDLETGNLPVNFSKRIVLSHIQKIYDPIGFTCPVTLQPKLLLQRLWEKKVNWDDELTEVQKMEFLSWRDQLHLLGNIKIPRNITGGTSERADWEIHTFCDASQDAYAAVVFLRVENEYKVSVQLLMAKSRVAPLKRPTINRLELLSCYIGVLLTDSVIKSLDLEDVPVTYWSDSSTALAWIRGNDEWGTFVGNRVRTICQLSNSEVWRHVPGVMNPADLPSRGCSASQLLASRWWEGPDWLKGQKDEWPNEEVPSKEEEVAAERRKTAVNLMTMPDRKEIPWYCSKSTFKKNVIAIGWLSRFIKYCSKNLEQLKKDDVLSVEEIEKAEKCLLMLVQKEVFPMKASVISGIHVNRGEDGLICVKTKLVNRDDAVGFRNPVLLPFSHILVDQLIREEHFKNKHAGAQFLVGKLREKYWIIRSRRAVKRVIAKCIVCRRFNCKKSNVVPASLPEGRVQTSRVFENVGVDFAGPLFLKDGQKEWILLVTCAVYRCVHLELVVSLSTPSAPVLWQDEEDHRWYTAIMVPTLLVLKML